MIEANTINNMDCLDGLAQMPSGCAKLIVALFYGFNPQRTARPI